MILYSTTLGKTRFNEILESIITLKEDISDDIKTLSRTERITKVKNNKIDLFSKFIGLDRNMLSCEIVLLYLDLLNKMKEKQ